MRVRAERERSSRRELSSRRTSDERFDEYGRSLRGTESGRDEPERAPPRHASCGLVTEQPLELRRERIRRARLESAADVQQQLSVACIAVLRPEEHRSSEGGGLDHRVQPGAVKSTAHKSHIGQRVELPEHADPIHDDDIRRQMWRKFFGIAGNFATCALTADWAFRRARAAPEKDPASAAATKAWS